MLDDARKAVALVLFCATAVDALGGLPPPTATHVLDLPRAVFDEDMSEDMPDPPFGRNILKTSTPASGNAHSLPLLPGHDKPVITPVHGETVRKFKGKAHSPASVPAHREANHALSHGEEKHTLVYGEAKHAPVYGKANRSPGHSKEEEDAGDDDDDDDDAEHASVHGKGNHVSGHGHHSMTRLERKVLVKKFARMREHFEHAKHKVVHELGGSSGVRNALVVVIALIVCLSLMFETAHEKLHEHTPESLHGVIHTVFQELTVLGFVSLFAFVALQTHVPGKISKDLFGAQSELHHLFHLVHMTVFLFMLIFIGLFGVMLVNTRMYKGMCAAAELQITKAEKDVIRAYGFWTRNPAPTVDIDAKKQREQAFFQMQMLLARSRFLAEFSGHRWVLTDKFHFGNYIAGCMDETLNNAINLRPVTWFCLLVLLIPVRGFMAIESMDIKIVIFILIGFVLLGLSMLLQQKMNQIRITMIGVVEPTGHSSAAEEKFLEDFNDVQEDPRRYLPPFQRASNFDPTKANFSSWVHKLLNGRTIPNRQEQLFWGMAKGMKLAFHILRSLIFFSAVYLTAFLVRFMHYMLQRHFLVAIVTVIAPVYMVLVTWPDIITNLNIIISIGHMKNYKQTKNVVQEYENAKALSAIKLINNMRLTWARHSRTTVSKLEKTISSAAVLTAGMPAPPRVLQRKASLVSAVEINSTKDKVHNEAKALFELFKGEDNKADADTLRKLLVAQGFSHYDIDQHIDKYWLLDFEHVLALLSDMTGHAECCGVVPVHTKEDIIMLVDAVFDEMDKDGNGSLKPREVILHLKEGKGAIDEDSILVLLSESDLDGDGEVDKEELTKLLISFSGSNE